MLKGKNTKKLYSCQSKVEQLDTRFFFKRLFGKKIYIKLISLKRKRRRTFFNANLYWKCVIECVSEKCFTVSKDMKVFLNGWILSLVELHQEGSAPSLGGRLVFLKVTKNILAFWWPWWNTSKYAELMSRQSSLVRRLSAHQVGQRPARSHIHCISTIQPFHWLGP